MAFELTEKQRRFIDEYLIDTNATQAAKRAGYSEKTAYSMGQQLLNKIEIRTEVEKRLAAEQNANIISANAIMDYLSRVVAGEETEEVITGKGDKRLKKVGAKDRIRAAELMAKRYALFIDRSEVQVDTSTKLSDIIGQLNGGD